LATAPKFAAAQEVDFRQQAKARFQVGFPSKGASAIMHLLRIGCT
jgi:hypothetical protein